jgi:hypothetical protein
LGNVSRRLIGLVALLALVPFFLASLRMGSSVTEFSSLAAQAWVRSADCARKTHTLLTICDDNRLSPLNYASPADDPGHALVLDILARVTDRPIDPRAVVKLNTVINYIGIGLVAALLWFTKLPFIAVSVTVAGVWLDGSYHEFGPHMAMIGLACFAVMLPLVVLLKPQSGRTFWYAAAVAVSQLSMLFRQPAGQMAIAAIIAVIIAGLASPHGRRAAIPLLITSIAIAFTPYALLRARDTLYGLPAVNQIEQHGVWHNVFLGLGAVDNPFGLHWNDADAEKAAREANPAVPYASDAYYATLRQEYFRLVAEHPWDVASIYTRKTLQLLKISVPALRFLRFWEVLLFVSAFWTIIRIRSRDPRTDGVVAMSVLFVWFFSAQAIIVVVEKVYFLPAYLFWGWAPGLRSSCLQAAGPLPSKAARSRPTEGE